MAFIDLQDVAKTFGASGSPRPVLDGVNLSIERGEFVSIVGFMGCGKSTVLNIAAGLLAPDRGRVLIDGAPVIGVRRGAAYVFQNYSLLPWLSALGNVQLAVATAFPSWSQAQHVEQSRKYLAMVGLGNALHRRPSQLSGGMRQRVAIARAFACEPEVLFLDEPFGALDALTRGNLQQELAGLCRSADPPVTTLMITNNVDEALLLSDRIVPMTARPPAAMGAPVAVDIPKPRTAERLQHDDEALRVRSRVVEWLTQYVTDGAAGAKAAPAPGSGESRLASGAARLQPRPRPAARRAPLELSALGKTFETPEGAVVAVKNVNAEIRDGEFVCVLGHSGCGKSTVLSIIAGLQRATLGGVVIDGREVTEPGADRAVVFQSPSLLPWLTARQNVELALARTEPPLTRSKRRDAATRYLELVGVLEAADQHPSQLSLGTQQCVSLARALSTQPRFLLLDEPFSTLDSMTRFALQDTLLDVWQREPKIVVMVTHDIDEALYLADRLILMTDGPAATVGEVMTLPFPRPRDRASVLEHPEYLRCRHHLIDFLEHHAQQSRAVA